MKLVHINKVGATGDLYVVREFSATDPGYGGGIPANPAFPSNTLPSGPPPHLPLGHTLVLVRDPAGVWHYAAIEPGQMVPPPIPDNALPGGPPNMVANPIAPGAAPKK